MLNLSRDSEQRETDEFEEAERRMLAEEAKVSLDFLLLHVCVCAERPAKLETHSWLEKYLLCLFRENQSKVVHLGLGLGLLYECSK